MTIKQLLYILINTLCTHIASAKAWQIDYEKSHIHFSGDHAGISFEGSFPNFKASIQFDPNNLESTKISANIDMRSTTVSDTLYTETLKTSDWFDSYKFPTARYQSKRIERIGKDKYLVTGELTIKGMTKSITTTVDISINSSQAIASGKANINRTVFNIGNSSDPSGDWVSVDIPVTLHIVAKEK